MKNLIPKEGEVCEEVKKGVDCIVLGWEQAGGTFLREDGDVSQ